MGTSPLGADQVQLDQALTVLNEIGQTLVTIDDLPQTLRNIAQKASAVLGADIVDLYEYIQARHEVVLPPVLVGVRRHPFVPKTKIYEDDVVMQVVKDSQPQYFSEAQGAASLIGRFEVPRSDAPTQRFVIREGVVSSATIPLMAAEETVGVMFVNFRQSQAFGPEQQALIEAFANFAAIAIHNARLFQAELEILGELNWLAQRLVTITETPQDLRQLLEQIAQHAQEVLKADLIEFYEYDEASDYFPLPQITVGDKRAPTVPKKEIYKDDTVYIWLVQRGSKTPQYFAQAQDFLELVGEYQVNRENRPAERFVVREGLLSTAVIPLCAGTERVGLMFANYRTAQAFDTATKSLIEAFANLAAIAIHNARLFKAEHERRLQSETLKEVARIVNSARTLEEVVETVFAQLRRVIEYEGASIQLINGDRRVPIGAQGWQKPVVDSKTDVFLRDVSKDPLIAEIVRTQQPRVLSDVNAEPLWEHFPETDQVKSWIGVPLVFKDQVVGLLILEHGQIGYYTESSRAVAAAFANQVAMAIHNSAQALALTELSKLAQRLGSIEASPENTQELLEQIARSALEVLRADFVAIYEYFQWRNEVNPRPAFAGLQQSSDVPKPEIKQDDVIWSLMAESNGEPLYIGDVPTSKIFSRPFVERPQGWDNRRFAVREKIISTAFLPLKTDSEIVGFLYVSYRASQMFAVEQKELIELFAGQAAIALKNARRVHDLKVLNDLGQRLSSRLQEKEILEAIHQYAGELMDTSNMYIALYDEASQMVRFGLRYDEGTQSSMESRVGGKGRTEAIIQSKKPLLIPTKADAVDWYEKHQGYSERKFASYVGVPMMVGGKVIGVIATFHPEKEYLYTQDDLAILQAFASQAAIALDNAHLFYDVNKQLKDTNERLDALIQFGKQLTSGIRLKEDEILNLIHHQANTLMDTNNMYIALYDEAQDAVRFGLARKDGQSIQVHPRKIDDAKRGRTEEIIRTKQPLFHPTRVEGLAWYAQPGHAEFVGETLGSWIGVPVLLGEKVLGVIATYHPTQDYVYSKNDLDILQEIADQAAVALDNASLFYNVNRKQKALVEFSQKLASSTRLKEDEILRLIHQQSSTLMDTDNMYIALYDELQDTVRFGLAWKDGQPIQVDSRKINDAKRGRTEEIIRTKQPLFHAARADGEKWYREPGHAEFVGDTLASWIGVPVLLGEKALGVIATYHPMEDFVYNENDLEILREIAAQAAIALENARLYEQAQQASKLEYWAEIGHLAGNLAHRIGNKGGTIRLRADELATYLHDKLPGDLEVEGKLEAILRNNQYLLNLSDLLFKPQRASEERMASVNIKLMLDSALSNAEIPPSVSVETHFPASLPPVIANRFFVEVFLEIMANAVEAMRTTPLKKLTITADYDNDWVRLRFTDTGVGITESSMKKIFDLFVSSRDRDTQNKHFGFGLWWVRTFLRKIGGDIDVESQPGAGATFTVRVPRGEHPQ